MRVISMLLTIGVLLVQSACAGDKADKKSSGSKDPSGATSSDEICKDLRSNTVSSDAEFTDLVSDLCTDAKLKELRDNAYKGSGTPVVNPAAVANGNSSQMRLATALLVNTDAKSYFNMMKVQLDKPSDFDDIFEFDSNVTYTRLSGDGSQVSYRYLNNKEDVAVEYEANTAFVEIVPNRTYVMTSKMSKSISCLQSLRGLQIMHAKDGAVEVIGVSDQTYDNQGDHNGMVNKAKKSFQEDMARGFRNGQKATNANRFYP